MAADLNRLSVLSYADGFTSWHYKQESSIGDVFPKGFFDSAAGLLSSGDTIMVSAPDGGAMLYVFKSVVHSDRILVQAMSSCLRAL